MEKNEKKEIVLHPDESLEIHVSAWRGKDLFVSIGENDDDMLALLSIDEFSEFIEVCQEMLEFAKGG